MLGGVLFASVWELGLPVLVAVVSVGLWAAAPDLRMNRVLRIALITSVAVTAVEVMLIGLVLFVLYLAGGSGGLH